MANVLIVIDGDYRFSGTAPREDFTYTTLVDALVSAGHRVTKAYRRIDPTDPDPPVVDPSADNDRFRFTTPALDPFDVVWLVGWRGRNIVRPATGDSPSLPDPEIAAIAAYMDNGGGVFATGDHDSRRRMHVRQGPPRPGDAKLVRVGDGTSPMPAGFPRNNPVISATARTRRSAVPAAATMSSIQRLMSGSRTSRIRPRRSSRHRPFRPTRSCSGAAEPVVQFRTICTRARFSASRRPHLFARRISTGRRSSRAAEGDRDGPDRSLCQSLRRYRRGRGRVVAGRG
jgi:hypothetical protein